MRCRVHPRLLPPTTHLPPNRNSCSIQGQRTSLQLALQVLLRTNPDIARSHRGIDQRPISPPLRSASTHRSHTALARFTTLKVLAAKVKTLAARVAMGHRPATPYLPTLQLMRSARRRLQLLLGHPLKPLLQMSTAENLLSLPLYPLQSWPPCLWSLLGPEPIRASPPPVKPPPCRPLSTLLA